MTNNISVEPIEAPEVPEAPGIPRELEDNTQQLEEPAQQPEEQQPTQQPEEAEAPEDTQQPEEPVQPAKRGRGRPKKAPAPEVVEKKPMGRPRKEPEPEPPTRPTTTTPSFSSEEVGQALQELLAAHRDAKAQRRRETYSNFNMF